MIRWRQPSITSVDPNNNIRDEMSARAGAEACGLFVAYEDHIPKFDACYASLQLLRNINIVSAISMLKALCGPLEGRPLVGFYRLSRLFHSI